MRSILAAAALCALVGCTAAEVQTAIVDAGTAAATGQVICQSEPTFLILSMRFPEGVIST